MAAAKPKIVNGGGLAARPHPGGPPSSGRVQAKSLAARSNKVMVAVIIGVIAVIALLVGYVGMATKYSESYYPNTQLFGMPVGDLTAAEAQAMLDEKLDSYTLHITGYTLDMEIPGSAIGLSFTSDQGAQDALASQNALLWPVMLFQAHDVSDSLGVEYNSEDLLTAIQAQIAETEAEEAKNSGNTGTSEVYFDTQTNRWVYESAGMADAIDTELLAQACSEPLYELRTEFLVPEECVTMLQTIDTVNQREQAVRLANQLCSQYNLTINMGGVASYTIEPATVAQWILIDENYGVSIDQSKVNAWLAMVRTLLSGADERTYTRPDGKVFTVSGGDYAGWRAQDIDAAMASIEAALTNGTSTVDIPCSQEGNGFLGLPGADWGKRYADVDMTEQYARFYDETGKLIWESEIVSGYYGTEYETPTGVYYVTPGKASPASLRSVGEYVYVDENGETQVEEEHVYGRDVEYWMPFIRNFIGFHDAWWQPAFGGELYKQAAYGSGGCINLPTEKAAELYDIIQPGDVVVTHY